MQTLYVYEDKRIGPKPIFWGADQAGLRDHNRRMDRGCLACGAAAPGRVCPDCNVCIACSPGCDECAPVRKRGA